jgi:protein-tyrosine phosphatase
MVCLGNICRSPLAEGLFREHAERAGRAGDFLIDSAGTGGWHAGEPPHAGSQAIAKSHGIDIAEQRSRKVEAEEIGDWDWILAMDSSNLRNLLAMGADPERTRLLLGFVPPGLNRDVPDPYYEGGFDRVYDLIDDACGHLLDFLDR